MSQSGIPISERKSELTASAHGGLEQTTIECGESGLRLGTGTQQGGVGRVLL